MIFSGPKKRTTIAAATAVATIGVLAGAYVAAQLLDDPSARPDGGVGSSTSSPSALPEAAGGEKKFLPDPTTKDLHPGDVLDDAPVGPFVDDNLTAAPLPDGTYLVVARDASLPERVTDGLVDEAGAAVNGTLGSPDSPSDQLTRLEQFAQYTFQTTGKHPAVILKSARLLASPHTSPDAWVGWARTDLDTFTTREGSPSEVQAELTTWMDQHGGQATFQIVTLDEQ